MQQSQNECNFTEGITATYVYIVLNFNEAVNGVDYRRQKIV